jgi:hypothetical protein
VSVSTLLGSAVPVVNIPGCPPNPDWIVGTVAYFLQNGTLPALDSQRRPRDYFGRTVHDRCPYEDEDEAKRLGQGGCLKDLGCKGPKTYADCPSRRWHSPGLNQLGTHWCIEGGAPCHGCTESGFPDAFSPFYTLGLAAGGTTPAPTPTPEPDGDSEPAAGGGGGGCFVVTACCGDVNDPTVVGLRAFRERRLRGRWWGDRLIRAYERYGPLLARWVAWSPRLRAVLRPALDGLRRLLA